MFRRWQLWLGISALTLAALLFATNPASAQRLGRGGWGGNNWNSGGWGYSNPGHYGYGNNYWNGGYGYGNNWYGQGYSSNYYSPWNTGYNSWYTPRSYAWDYYPGDYYSNSGYYSDYEPNYYYSQTPYYQQRQGYTSFYPQNQDQNISRNAALVHVRVPDNAELWFGGEKTSQTGSMRDFVTPDLGQNKDYFYTLKARWTDRDGKSVERTRRVTVRPGARVMVDFMRNDQADDRNRDERRDDNRNVTPPADRTTAPAPADRTTAPAPADRTTAPADRTTAPAPADRTTPSREGVPAPAPRNDNNNRQRNDQPVP